MLHPLQGPPKQLEHAFVSALIVQLDAIFACLVFVNEPYVCFC